MYFEYLVNNINLLLYTCKKIYNGEIGGSAISEDGDAGSLRVECSSSDGDDEERGLDVYRLRFNSNSTDSSFEYPAASSSIHNAQQTPSTSSGSVNVNASIKVCNVFIRIMIVNF